MSFSRRHFIKAGITATVFAGLPLNFASASDKKGEKAPGRADPGAAVDYYTRTTFEPYVNTEFSVYLTQSNIQALKLVKVEDYFKTLTDVTPLLGEECFSLLLSNSAKNPFPQDTYLIDHSALGRFYMFLVPVSGSSKGGRDYYEAIFYRRQQSLGQQSLESVTQAKSSVGEARPGRQMEQDMLKYGSMTAAVAARAKVPSAPVRPAFTLTMAHAPVIGGLRLGMTAEQALALFPGSESDAEIRSALSRSSGPLGVSSFTLRPEKYSSKSNFDRVAQISLKLLDDRVSSLYVGYDAPVWEHVDEFVAKFTEGRNLPAADYWEAHNGMDTQLKTLKGADLEISLFAGGQNVSINYVQVRDLAAERTLKERRAKNSKQ